MRENGLRMGLYRGSHAPITTLSHGVRVDQNTQNPLLCRNKRFFVNNFFSFGPRVLGPSPAHPEVATPDRMQPAPSLYDVGKW